MTSYRLYIKDYAGHIREARSFDCADDVEAQARAEADRDPRGKELWNQDRLVCEYPQPADEETSPA
jgi:hypothetical protein